MYSRYSSPSPPPPPPQLAGNKQVQPLGGAGIGHVGVKEGRRGTWVWREDAQRKVRHFLFGAERWDERDVRPWDFGHDSHARCGSTGQPTGASVCSVVWALRPAWEALERVC